MKRAARKQTRRDIGGRRRWNRAAEGSRYQRSEAFPTRSTYLRSLPGTRLARASSRSCLGYASSFCLAETAASNRVLQHLPFHSFNTGRRTAFAILFACLCPSGACFPTAPHLFALVMTPSVGSASDHSRIDAVQRAPAPFLHTKEVDVPLTGLARIGVAQARDPRNATPCPAPLTGSNLPRGAYFYRLDVVRAVSS